MSNHPEDLMLFVLGSGPDWMACDYPERPPDAYEIYYDGCDKCMMKLRADLAMRGDIRLTNGFGDETTRSELLERVAEVAGE